jgi:MFS transporter, DHA1 family, tetracycline resistance protein
MQQSNSRLLALFLVIFIDTLGYFMVMLAIQRLVPASLISLTLMLSPLAFIIFSPIVGRLSDIWGRKRVILYCLIASLLGFVIPLLGIATHLAWPIMLGRFIAGIGTSSQPIAQASITDFSSGKKKAFNLGLIGLSMTLAMVLGPLAAEHLLTVSAPYWIGTGLAVFNIILLITTFSETHQANTQSISLRQRLRLLTPAICLVMLSFFFGEIIWSGYYQAAYLGFLSREFHLTKNTIGIFIASIGLFMCLGLTLVYPLWLKRTSVRHIGLASVIIYTVCFIPLTLTHHINAHWLIAPVIALFFGTFYPCILHIVSELTPSHSQGWMLGVASQILGLAWMLTAFSITASSRTITFSCLALGIIATICFTLGTKKNARA